MNAPSTTIAATAGERVQTVVFVRHAVAQHNVLDRRTGQPPDLHDPAWFDPPLLLEGKSEALLAGERIRNWWQQQQQQMSQDDRDAAPAIDLIITSPLTRCLQTTLLAFLPGVPYSRQATPVFCVENVREAYGRHYPDKRREKSLLMEHWRMVQFEESMTERDERWDPHERESWEDLGHRIDAFLNWLVSTRPEQRVVIVSHGVWIESLLRKYAPTALGDRRVYNCDAYACQAVSETTSGRFLRLQQVHLISSTTIAAPADGSQHR